MTISKEQIEAALTGINAINDGGDCIDWYVAHEETIRTVLQERLYGFGCECCDGKGLIEVEPDSIFFHPCDTCNPDGNRAFKDGYLLAQHEMQQVPQPAEALEALFRIMTCMAQHGATYDGLRSDRKIIEAALQRNEALEIQLQFSRDGFDGLIKALREKEEKILELVKSRDDVPQWLDYIGIKNLASEVCGAFSLNEATQSTDKAAAVRQAIDWIAYRYNILPKQGISLRSGNPLPAAPKPTGE